MAQPSAWFDGSDMLVRLAGLRSSTMASGVFLTSSTGVTVDIWNNRTTGSTGNKKVTGLNLPYTTAYGSTGRYEVAVQSTAHGMSVGDVGFAHIKVTHSGLDREWRVPFRVEYDRS